MLARQERTRAGIVDAARELVAAGGLGAASMAEVAAAAGVGVGTVYRYFPSKTDLLSELVSHTCRHELDIVRSVATEADSAPRDRLVAAVTVFSSRALRSARTAYAMIAEPTDADVEHLRLEIRAELADIFADVIREGVDQGELPPQSAAIAGTALVGAVSEVLVGPLASRTSVEADADQLLSEIGRFALSAVAGLDPTWASLTIEVNS